MSASAPGGNRKSAPIAYQWKMAVASLAALALLTSMPAYGFLARPAIFAAIGPVTKAPSGWLQFCAENPDACRPSTEEPRDVTLTPDLLQRKRRPSTTFRNMS